MNHSKLTKIGIALAVAATPFHLNASLAGNQEALDACAAALVEQLSAEQGAPMVYNLDPDSKAGKGDLKRRQVIHLDARDPESREVVARVDCVLDSRANVKKLIEVPIDAPDAGLRATQL